MIMKGSARCGRRTMSWPLRGDGGGPFRGDGERGSATVWAVGLAALLFAVVMAVVFTGAVRVARHQAQAAADLSALAAARVAFADPGESCGKASLIAAGNGAEITRCSVGDDGIADVQAAVWLSLPVPFGSGGTRVTARARAGPVHITGPGE